MACQQRTLNVDIQGLENRQSSLTLLHDMQDAERGPETCPLGHLVHEVEPYLADVP